MTEEWALHLGKIWNDVMAFNFTTLISANGAGISVITAIELKYVATCYCRLRNVGALERPKGLYTKSKACTLLAGELTMSLGNVIIVCNTILLWECMISYSRSIKSSSGEIADPPMRVEAIAKVSF